MQNLMYQLYHIFESVYVSALRSLWDAHHLIQTCTSFATPEWTFPKYAQVANETDGKHCQQLGPNEGDCKACKQPTKHNLKKMWKEPSKPVLYYSICAFWDLTKAIA